jgi:hypothetical protein
MIANFLTSLQTLVDEHGRVHCLFFKLEHRNRTGFFETTQRADSARLERKTNTRNNLIVAAYGQLELRKSVRALPTASLL